MPGRELGAGLCGGAITRTGSASSVISVLSRRGFTWQRGGSFRNLQDMTRGERIPSVYSARRLLPSLGFAARFYHASIRRVEGGVERSVQVMRCVSATRHGAAGVP
jgi:hypothetical protein